MPLARDSADTRRIVWSRNERTLWPEGLATTRRSQRYYPKPPQGAGPAAALTWRRAVSATGHTGRAAVLPASVGAPSGVGLRAKRSFVGKVPRQRALVRGLAHPAHEPAPLGTDARAGRCRDFCTRLFVYLNKRASIQFNKRPCLPHSLWSSSCWLSRVTRLRRGN